MRKDKPPSPLTAANIEEIERRRTEVRVRLRDMPHDEIEASEIDPENPPLTDEQLSNMRPAHEVHPELIARRLRGPRRSRPESPKETLSIQVDTEVLRRLRATGAGWQSRINDMLRKLLGM